MSQALSQSRVRRSAPARPPSLRLSYASVTGGPPNQPGAHAHCARRSGAHLLFGWRAEDTKRLRPRDRCSQHQTRRLTYASCFPHECRFWVERRSYHEPKGRSASAESATPQGPAPRSQNGHKRSFRCLSFGTQPDEREHHRWHGERGQPLVMFRSRNFTTRSQPAAAAVAVSRALPPYASGSGTSGCSDQLRVVGRFGGKQAQCPAPG